MGRKISGLSSNRYQVDSKQVLRSCARMFYCTRLSSRDSVLFLTLGLKYKSLTLWVVNVHFFCRHMYWVNGGRKPTIEIADLDGSNRRTLFKNPTLPAGLTIDSSTGLIFWADQERRVIECANLNGTNRRIVVSGLPKTFALTQFKDYIYYADSSTIYRANKTNGLDPTRIESNIDIIMDILVFHSSRQEGM